VAKVNFSNEDANSLSKRQHHPSINDSNPDEEVKLVLDSISYDCSILKFLLRAKESVQNVGNLTPTAG